MEYERIHKIQTGIISPSKLRMKLIGPHHQRKKDGSNSNSSRTSPSRLADSEFVKSGLLNPEIEDFYDQVPGFDLSSVRLPADKAPMENGEPGPNNTMHQLTKTDSCNLSTVHPLRNLDDDNNLDYDSNASSSSFEFHKAERSLHGSMARSISRPIPSKWNNAEKWIMSRNAAQANCSKKTGGPGSGGRFPVTNVVRVAPDSGSFDHRAPVNRVADTKRVDFCQPASQMGMEKFSFVPPSMHPSLCQANGETALANLCPQTKELKEGVHGDMLCTKPMTEGSTSMSEDSKALPAIRSVAMRDMGTEMTPIPSQEPSRTSTPVGATTPLRSPSSSLPSTPRRGAPASTRMMDLTENGKRELSEQELKEKTRKEIVALGVQLGKMNIAAWASKDEQEKRTSLGSSNFDEIGRIENEKRAAAWEEAEKSKHLARYKREEIKIQAWESQQKAKLDAEIQRVEAQVEQLRAQAHAKMVKKIEMARQKSEEKRAAAEARRNREAERTAAQVEFIRQTGRIPSSNFICCGWF